MERSEFSNSDNLIDNKVSEDKPIQCDKPTQCDKPVNLIQTTSQFDFSPFINLFNNGKLDIEMLKWMDKGGINFLMWCCIYYNRDDIKKTSLIEQIIDKFDLFCMPQQISVDKYTALMLACKNKLSSVALKLLQFGDMCMPQIANSENKTAFSYACKNEMEDVALKLIETNTPLNLQSFIYACENKMENVCLKMIEKNKEILTWPFSETKGNSLLMYICNLNLEKVALKIVDSIKEGCNPGHTNSDRETPLYCACKNKMETLAIKLIDTFGDDCKPDYICTNTKNTALIIACHNNMEKVAIKLIDTFGRSCNPTHINSYQYTAFIFAVDNRMITLISKFVTYFDKSMELIKERKYERGKGYLPCV
jgi:hypothetical protein